MLVNLIYFKDASINGNFGDELSKFITQSLINSNKYTLVYNQPNIKRNLVCIGSYIHNAPDNSYIFGSGVRTLTNDEHGHRYKKLIVRSVRGPLTKKFLVNRGINVPDVFGDPALLLPKFYTPKLILGLNKKVGVIPHKSNYDKYLNINKNYFHLISPTDKWTTVIDKLCSCRAIVSSSLHGLICADAYNIPNVWLDEHKLSEGDFKFCDYFESQHRAYHKITELKFFKDAELYTSGNTIDLQKMIDVFPFK